MCGKSLVNFANIKKYCIVLHGTNMCLFYKIGGSAMLGWAVTFFVLAIIAALLGFGGIAGATAGLAQILFWIFLALLVLSFIARAVRGR